MKIHTVLGVIVLSSVTLNAYADEPAMKPIVVSERPTHTQLAKKQAAYHAKRHGNKEKAPIKPIVTIKKRSLVGMSTLLAARGHWALVPKGAVIHIPKHLKEKIVSKPQGTLQDWPVFLRENAGWIHLFPVDLEIARGNKTVDEKEMKAYKTMGKMVIATSGGYPVSVAAKALVPPVADKKK